MRRTALSLVLAVALLGAMAVPALAANPTVSITVKAGVVSITNSVETWEIGIVETGGAAKKWGDSDTNSTLTNTGTVNVDVKIIGTDLVHAGNATLNWVLASDGLAGDQIYGLNATITDGDGYTIIVKKTGDTPVNLVAGLPHTALNTETWSMRFAIPTAFDASDDGLEKSGSVTLVASKAA